MDTNTTGSEQAVSALMCFKDQGRCCGPDCMAYLSQAPEGVYYEGEAWAHCKVLVDQDRTARHLVVLASQLGELAKHARHRSAVSARSAQMDGSV